MIGFCPAFKGVIEFDLTVEVFGQRVTRKAKSKSRPARRRERGDPESESRACPDPYPAQGQRYDR